jgi:site-specific recombinase XerD
MAIFKRGRVYWYHFWFNGDHIQESTHQGNPRTSRQMESAKRTELAKDADARLSRAKELGCTPEDLIRCVECEKLFNASVAVENRFCGHTCHDRWESERKPPVPTLADFAQRFIDEIQVRCAEKPLTIEFYASKLKNLLKFNPLASVRLDRIDEELIAAYIQNRSKAVSAVSVNRELATLRRLLRIAHDWQIIPRVPKIRLNLKAERNREYVMDHATERNYLEFAPQPLRDAAMLMLDTGLRVGELLSLEWSQVHLQPVGKARFGFIRIRKGKSKNAPRNLSLSPRVRVMLEARQAEAKSARVFNDESGLAPLSRFSLRDQHSKMRESLKLPKDAVIHSFRHTFGTRLGESGADAFAIMRAMGHSSVTVSQKYVHPTPETMERAFERLNAANEKAMAALPGPGSVPALAAGETAPDDQKRPAPATNSATVQGRVLTAGGKAA